MTATFPAFFVVARGGSEEGIRDGEHPSIFDCGPERNPAVKGKRFASAARQVANVNAQGSPKKVLTSCCAEIYSSDRSAQE